MPNSFCLIYCTNKSSMVKYKIIMGLCTYKQNPNNEVAGMLNNEKIILMTKLSLYEQENDKKEIKSSRYYKSDYMLLKLVSSFLSVTLGYLLCLLLWFMYRSDKVITSLTTTGRFVGLAVVVGLIYVVVTLVYMIFSYAFYSHKFRAIRKNLKEYNGDLKTLHRIQEMEYDAIIDALEEGSEEES